MKDVEEFIIAPPGKFSLNLRELWRYHELFYFFTWRDIKVKYKQTALGVLWAILQPVSMMLVFTFLFGRALKVNSEGIPYPLFVFSGLILWNLFSTGITNAGNSMVVHANIIKKIYFPRLIIPVSAVLSSVVDFCFAFTVFIAMLLWYKTQINFLEALIFWPAGILLACLGSVGPGCWLSALNVKYRDFRYVIPFLVQVLLFLTPVFYPVTMVSNHWLRIALALNPMYAAIEIFRSPLVHGVSNPSFVWISIASGVFLFVLGLLYFKKTEVHFADLA